MIVPMKKITLLCLTKDRTRVIWKLRDLGVMHIVQGKKPTSEMLTKSELSLADVTQVVAQLSTQKKGKTSQLEHSPEEVLALSLNAIDHVAALKLKLETVNKNIEQLRPWGDFDFSMLQQLETKGVHVYLCTSTADRYETFKSQYYVEMISQDKKNLHYVIASLEPIAIETIPFAQIPDHITLNMAYALHQKTVRQLAEEETNLAELAHHVEAIKPIQSHFKDEVNFQTAVGGMESIENLSYMEGYVPADSMDAVTDFAKKSGAAVAFEDPAEGEFVPTYLRIPKYARMIKPLLDFIGILPGYREWDVAVCLLFFFSIFFAMIINDAGYGFVFLLCSIGGLIAFRNKPKGLAVAQLTTILSLFAIVWGILNGSYFGIPPETLKKMDLGVLVKFGETFDFYPSWIKGIDKFKSPNVNIVQLNLEYFCFVVALVHLTIARTWKFCYFMKNKEIRTGLAQIGWILFLVCNFFMAVDFVIFPGSRPEFVPMGYAVGFVFIALGIKWTDVGDIFNLPFSLINSFVDTLSYIRLFAVGLAGSYIAMNFNSIAVGLIDIHPAFIIFTVLILLMGHLLNIALCLMGVLVHAIRLNALEFSNHMGLEWTGVEYSPLAREEKVKKNNS